VRGTCICLFAIVPAEQSGERSLFVLIAPSYFFFLPVPFSEEDLELSELLEDSEDFESEDFGSDDFDSPAFSLLFEAAPSPEPSFDELSGFFPA